jgi:hypothetical protein
VYVELSAYGAEAHEAGTLGTAAEDVLASEGQTAIQAHLDTSEPPDLMIITSSGIDQILLARA